MVNRYRKIKKGENIRRYCPGLGLPGQLVTSASGLLIFCFQDAQKAYYTTYQYYLNVFISG